MNINDIAEVIEQAALEIERLKKCVSELDYSLEDRECWDKHRHDAKNFKNLSRVNIHWHRTRSFCVSKRIIRNNKNKPYGKK